MPADRHEAEAREAIRNGRGGALLNHIAAALRAAERRGAERMRERAAQAMEWLAGEMLKEPVAPQDRHDAYVYLGAAQRILALPLEAGE